MVTYPIRWHKTSNGPGATADPVMDSYNTVVLAHDTAAAEAAGYPRRNWCVVTPRSIKIGPRGMRARYVVAVDLTAAELEEMLHHDSVWPAFVMDGDPRIVLVRPGSADT